MPTGSAIVTAETDTLLAETGTLRGKGDVAVMAVVAVTGAGGRGPQGKRPEELEVEVVVVVAKTSFPLFKGSALRHRR